MDFISNKKPQIQEMLEVIGISSIDQLFKVIPSALKQAPITQDDGLSEFEGQKLMEALAQKNTFLHYQNYLGAGAYEHHIPALVSAICSKSEFLTSYTPYQAEASQGMLQIIFEFQSAICALTGLDAANASLYDGASACGEALLMALRLQQRRNKVLIARSVHPNYQGVAAQYVRSHETQIETIPFLADGRLDEKHLLNSLNDKTAAVLVQCPNFLGVVENFKSLSEKIHASGALFIISANPLAYGLYASAAEMGADIAIGDCQPFGLALQFGGPYAGYMAARTEFLRQLPGRIVGETLDAKGQRGFVLTLQAREQHIRREKATSNICTNQALAALASLIAMLWYGKEGIPKLALTNYQRAAYLREKLKALPNVALMGEAPIFNEFAMRFSKPLEHVQKHFRSQGIEPGIPLEKFYPEMKEWLLVAVTETKDQSQLNEYIRTAKEIA